LPRRDRVLIVFGLLGLVLLGGVLSPISASAVDPTQWTTKVEPITRDAYGNPAQASFTISGPATSYAICLKMTDFPAYNTAAANYDTRTYGGYAPCVKFSWTSGASNNHRVGSHFTFGGPGTYEVDWYVPDVPANGGILVGTAGTLKWADTQDVYSPCPWDPQLQIGVWRPSRLILRNRCKTLTGTVTAAVVGPNSLDKDRTWSLAKMHAEYILRDKTFLPSPALGSTWTIVGVYGCDSFHGWKEYHAVFQATNSAGTTYLSGPEYGTTTPSVSGSWTTKTCT
jgi:hypothetical protein